jgi:hypothetical protein
VDSYIEGFATRVVGLVSKLVNPQHGSPYTQRGTAPGKNNNGKNKIGRKTKNSRMSEASGEFPLNIKDTLGIVTDGRESSTRQVNGIAVVTSGALIRDDHGDALAIIQVGDVHRLSANVLVIYRRIFDESKFY